MLPCLLVDSQNHFFNSVREQVEIKVTMNQSWGVTEQWRCRCPLGSTRVRAGDENGRQRWQF
jgi:hypothetical protein